MRRSLYLLGSSLLLMLFWALSPKAFGQGALVTTLAGSEREGSANGIGTTASFKYPENVAVDSHGNVYVTDFGNNQIRKITSDGQVSTLAGSGKPGFRNGKGKAATFDRPFGIAVDGYGNVYVGDTGNMRIRKISTSGLVTTLAGSGKIGSANGIGGAASFSFPGGVAVDSSGNVYVADSSNGLIRKITPGGLVTTLAGSGGREETNGTGIAASFDNPMGIAVDSSGNVYVGERENNLVRKITPDGRVTTLAGSGAPRGSNNGVGTAASFWEPVGLAVDASGNVYVADKQNDLIREISPEGMVTTLAGSGNSGFANGSGIAASFSNPSGVAVDVSGNVYVADSDNNLVRKIQNNPGSGNSNGGSTTMESPIAPVAEVSNNLKPHGPPSQDCNPNYPTGLTGTLRTAVGVFFTYSPEGDSQIESDKAAQYIKRGIAQLAATNPNGPQFVFDFKGRYDLVFRFSFAGRGRNSAGKYTAYWANVDSNDNWGGLLGFSTTAHEPTESDLFGDWDSIILDEAIETWYKFIANGWTCH